VSVIKKGEQEADETESRPEGLLVQSGWVSVNDPWPTTPTSEPEVETTTNGEPDISGHSADSDSMIITKNDSEAMDIGSAANQTASDSDSDPVITATPRDLRKIRGHNFMRRPDIAQGNDSMDVTDSDSDPVVTATPRTLRKAGKLQSIKITDSDSETVIEQTLNEPLTATKKVKSTPRSAARKATAAITLAVAVDATALAETKAQLAMKQIKTKTTHVVESPNTPVAKDAADMVKLLPRGAAQRASIAIAAVASADLTALAKAKREKKKRRDKDVEMTDA